MQMAREEVAEVSYCYYSQDSREIVQKFPCMEAAKFTDRDRTFWDVLPAAPCGHFRTLCPAQLISDDNQKILDHDRNPSLQFGFM